MNIHALKTSSQAAPDWRETLAELGPQFAEEARRSDESNTYVAANMALLRERGFLGLAVPLELGGGGLGYRDLSDMLRELAHHCSATALVLAMHTHVAAAAAWRWRHQQAPTDGLLKRVAAERIQLLSSGGSDWIASSGIAKKVDGGYRIHARKVFASGAPSANLLMTSAIHEDAPDGPTVLHFGVPMKAEGVSIAETWDTLGMRGTASHDVILDGVFVADAAIGGRRKPGVWDMTFHVVSLIAFPLVYSVYAGVAEHARDVAVEVAAKRREVNVELVGALDTELAATRITLDAFVAFAETAQPGPQTTNTIFISRTLVARHAIRTVEFALEAAGGAAYCRRTELERLFRDVQGARFHPLPESQQRRIAGRLALGLPIDG